MYARLSFLNTYFSSKSFNNGSHGNHDTATTQHKRKNTMDVSKIARKKHAQYIICHVRMFYFSKAGFFQIYI